MAADTPRGESELAIFSRFSRAFSHVVRGDLSVITNEVSYLATTMPSEELVRVRSRCSQIAATVSKIAGLKSEASPTWLAIDDVARIFGSRLRAPTAERISLDRVKIERLASIVRQILGDSEAPWMAEWSPQYGLALSVQISKSSGRSATYASWSSFAAGELGERSVIDAVVADLIMRAHQWRLGIELQEQLVRCRIFIPPASGVQRERECA
jgi:hypothetical protein